jgi:hypothetical protein
MWDIWREHDSRAGGVEAKASAEQRAVVAEAVAEAKLAAGLRAAVAETRVKTMGGELVAAKADLGRLKSDNPGRSEVR